MKVSAAADAGERHERLAELARQSVAQPRAEFEPLHITVKLPGAGSQVERAADGHLVEIIAGNRTAEGEHGLVCGWGCGLRCGFRRDAELNVAQRPRAG